MSDTMRDMWVSAVRDLRETYEREKRLWSEIERMSDLLETCGEQPGFLALAARIGHWNAEGLRSYRGVGDQAMLRLALLPRPVLRPQAVFAIGKRAAAAVDWLLPELNRDA